MPYTKQIRITRPVELEFVYPIDEVDYIDPVTAKVYKLYNTDQGAVEEYVGGEEFVVEYPGDEDEDATLFSVPEMGGSVWIPNDAWDLVFPGRGATVGAMPEQPAEDTNALVAAILRIADAVAPVPADKV